MIKTEYRDKNGSTTRVDSLRYTYDLNGRIIQKIAYGTMQNDTTFIYEEGKLVSKTIIRNEFTSSPLTETYYYENGKMVRKTVKDNTGNFDESFYNASGDIIRSKGNFSDGKTYDISFEYEYDLSGNWVKKNTFYPDTGKRDGYRKRTIAYF